MERQPLIDFHCDLLYYLASSAKHTALDPQSRCSLVQLDEGGVGFQVLAIFTPTKKGSAAFGNKQFELFCALPDEHKDLCQCAWQNAPNKVQLAYAIENASALLEEDEPLSLLFERLDKMQQQAGAPRYISLTWNEENRFGGGNNTEVGLKPDGKELLDFMAESTICIDLSHTSDALAHDILKHLDGQKKPLTPIASHSNFRAIANQKRNLPDEIAQEIGKRGGILGLNFVRRFIGPSFDTIAVHIDKAIELGLEDSLVFGADFFSDLPSPSGLLTSFYPFFHKGYDTASCYPQVMELLAKKFPSSLNIKIAYKNAHRFAHDHSWRYWGD